MISDNIQCSASIGITQHTHSATKVQYSYPELLLSVKKYTEKILRYTHMGQKAVPYAYGTPRWVYAYGTSHTCMGQYMHTGQNITNALEYEASLSNLNMYVLLCVP